MAKGENHSHELLEIEEEEHRFTQQKPSVADKAIMHSFTIEPNPARQSFNIKMAKADENQFLDIYSITAMVVGHYEIAPGQINGEISCNNLQPGIYTIKLSSKDGNIKDVRRITIIK